jgi:transcriptional regulator with XRE-family HTH domain
MTLKEMALALGFISHSYASEIETSKKKPNTEMIIQIADLFGVTVDQLVRDEIDLDE